MLKGATLFLLWEGVPHRRTKDMDFLRFGSSDQNALKNVVLEICNQKAEDDGITFEMNSLVIGPIRAQQEYDGYRIEVMVSLGQARLKLWMDIGFGDKVKPNRVKWPSLLDAPEPEINVYPKEAVIAEKFHAMVEHGIDNSRMKDFFDLHYMATKHSFQSTAIIQAISATFGSRKVTLPEQLPIGLTDEFATNGMKNKQWTGFLKKNSSSDLKLPEAIQVIRNFLWPLVEHMRDGATDDLKWRPGGPWKA
ncbi:MAG: nucleotidyl transferase AbiEii/AbiGii toxin family protein [Planctomycetes bacterium]|nr:nucleotidyl transferase AbiEii/AbiGii toxin family protein [Planctomycetota bacterium]